jgi:DNA invertase Pin-like site-specific DNA recombinase
MSSPALVQAHHLARRAAIYIRQSSQGQVVTNLESQRLQLAMREHARRLGWPDERIDVVDTDTGRSGASTSGRDAYKDLLSDVALGKIGIVLSYDTARLSRNCSDWYPLLDVCALKGSLVADRDGVYDPSSVNGRMLLGMKGILSEVELHTIRGRLTAGLQSKARRGELAQILPVGLVREEDGHVVKEPDQQIQRIIELVFTTFLERRSVFQVLKYFRDNGLLVPRRIRNDEVLWRKPTAAIIMKFLKNPAYAGAFAYGKKTSTRATPDGKPRAKYRKMEDWLVLLHDRFPAYVTWETFERIQTILADNYAEYQERGTRGAARSGQALLQGIAYCGRCGRKLVVRYKGRTRYVCSSRQQNGVEPICFYVPGDPIEQKVVEYFLQAVAPAELDLYETAQLGRRKANAAADAAQEQQIQRLQYEADLARRRYERADPDNRLVAGELERRWEAALQALADAQASFQAVRDDRDRVVPLSISRELRAAFTSVGEALPGAWAGTALTNANRKALLRCLVDKVVIDRPPERRDAALIRVVWRGGAVSEAEVSLPVARTADLGKFAELEEAVLELAREGHTDEAIARTLGERGFRSALRDHLRVDTVKEIRRKTLPRRPGKSPAIPGFLTVPQVAARLDFGKAWLYNAIRHGRVELALDPERGVYLIPDRPDVLGALRQLRDGQVASVPAAIIRGDEGHRDV